MQTDKNALVHLLPGISKYKSFVSFQTNRHKKDILCTVHCPPSLLATGSSDGEILVWDLVSGHIQCRFVGPNEAEDQNTEGDSEALM